MPNASTSTLITLVPYTHIYCAQSWHYVWQQTCNKINITVSHAGVILTNCSDKMSNVEQLDVLNGPVMTAEQVGHMDGAH